MSEDLAYMRGRADDLPVPPPETGPMIEVLSVLHDRVSDEREKSETPPLRDLTALVMKDAMCADGAARKGRRDVTEALLVEVAANAILALIELRRRRA